MSFGSSPSASVLEVVSKTVSVENREWEGSSTELSETLHLNMAVRRLTKRLNVNARHILEEYRVKYENKTQHTGQRIWPTYMVVEALTFEIIE